MSLIIETPVTERFDRSVVQENRAVRVSSMATEDAKFVRTLLSRNTTVVVHTTTLAAYVAALVKAQQWSFTIEDAVIRSLAGFSVRLMGGNEAPQTVADIARKIDEAIEEQITPEDEITFDLAFNTIVATLRSVFGQQLKVTGWMPGFTVAEGNRVIELSGDACPQCQVNPTGYKAHSKNPSLYCLNREDCGWELKR